MRNNGSTRALSDTRHRRILDEMLCLPTAPFAEHAVIEYISAFCARRGHLTVSRDAAGNILVRVRQGNRRVARPICITAHMDHPGFVADRMVGAGRLKVMWRGGVHKEYFVGRGVRFHVNGGWVRGRIRSIKTARKEGQDRVETAVADVAHDVPSGSVGMWDFPDPTVRGNRIYARGCDDLGGAAALLCTMDELSRGRRACDAYFLFTRAEEVGFVGAIAAAKAKTIPKKCYVVVMETSAERANARLGDGPILRVGDRTTTFTPEATAHCRRIARELAEADKGFRFQRKLMDGGTCESSAFCALGYEATGICVALGNYHNMNTKRRKVGPEYIDLSDFDNVVKWFVALGRARHAYNGRDELFQTQLRALERTYSPLLRRSRQHAC